MTAPLPTAHLYKPIEQWIPQNRGFYAGFRRWLRDGGYSDSTISLYATATRLAMGWLDTAYWLIDPEADLDRVREIIAAHYESEGTRSTYFKGLAKLAEYLRHRCHRPKPRKPINWAYFLDSLPSRLGQDLRDYIGHRQRSWLPELRTRLSGTTLSHLTLSLRWMARAGLLTAIQDLTPELWFDYLDTRLEAGISPITVNGELRELQQFLRYLKDLDRPICHRMLRVKPVGQSKHLPRDIPVHQLRVLLAEIEKEAASSHANPRRMGILDRAWVHLMLHCGLRVGEVRRLGLADLDLEGRKLRIDQSKGLKDRVVCFTSATLDALRAYLEMRGPSATDHLFLYRHQPLSSSYCGQRLRTYARRCGVRATPHRLRHSFATLLLNAGAPVLTVQALLGHKHVDTTLTYARLYDGTVAADYYRAMAEVETRFDDGNNESTPPDSGQLLALVDALHTGTLNDSQRETVQALRAGILALAGNGNGSRAKAV
jgi:site-specific recombinase XerD